MKAWHFVQENGLMRYENTLVEAGKTYRIDPPIEMCERGYHASVKLLDALYYAPGPIICRVELSGEIIEGDDKAVATERTVLWMADATQTLREFARGCALEVAHFWDMPDVVRKYLESGDETLRAAAWAEARDAARDAARAAAWAEARDAARAEAWAEAWEKQNAKLESMLEALK